MNEVDPNPEPADLLDRWLDAYELVYADPTKLGTVDCPNCGARDLHLVFVSFVDVPVAVMPAFWCGTCLQGLPPARAPLPSWAKAVPAGQADIPDYRLVT